MSRSTPNDTKALARFVLAPAKRAGRSLDQQWSDLASFLRGPASALARWLAVAQMHTIHREMMGPGTMAARRATSQTVGHFIERACAETGLSRQSVYNYVERGRALAEALGPAIVREMLSGKEPIANDENILIKVAQLPGSKAIKVVEAYMHGRGEAAAARLAEKLLHEQQIAGLMTRHEAQLRGSRLAADEGPPDVRNVVLFGDALLHLRETIPAEIVQCVVTSPPFYAQRDFGTRHWFGGDPGCRHDRRVAHPPFHSGAVAPTKYRTPRASQDGQTAITHSCSKCGAWFGQLGQEPDLGMYLDHIVEVFREVRRVLRPDGVCWVEIGDSHNAGTSAPSPSPDSSGTDVGSWQSRTRTGRRRSDVPGLAAKSLLLVPQRLAVALQEDGWIVRAMIVNQKVAPLPESVQDRPTRSHTTIIMLAKSENYFYDPVAVMEAAVGITNSRGDPTARRRGTPRKWAGYETVGVGSVAARNCRDVWSLPVGRFPDAHTATFPPALPERCVLASTSEHGACSACAAPWRRRTHQPMPGGNIRRDGSVGRTASKFKAARMRAGRLLGGTEFASPERETIGWEPTCKCGVGDVKPSLVLDPFAGSGTTLMVARQLGRDYVGIEINEREYRPLIERRLADAGRPRGGRSDRNGTRRPAARS